MNIRRFVANDMREALTAIRADLGADAVMLSSRKLPNGVEVIAAIDYDDSLLGGGEPPTTAGRRRRARAQLDEYEQSRASARGRQRGRSGSGSGRRLRLAAPAGPAPARSTRRRDVVRGARDQGSAAPARDPARELRVERFEPPSARARAVVARAREARRRLGAGGRARRRGAARRRVIRKPCGSSCAGSASGCRSCRGTWPTTAACSRSSGPTGVGKTTSIAKIAARFVLRHSVEQLGLVSTDTYRIGARQQLSNFARILRAPMHVAENAADLRRVLDGFADKKLVLIDTAGMSQRDVRLANQFTTLQGRRPPRAHRARAVGRRRPRLPRRSAQGVPSREPGGVDRHEAR